MKMDGFGKFFDQPSCEFGGKYMEVRGGETNTNTNRKKDTNRNYFVTLGDYGISYSKYVKVKRNPYSHDLHETGDKKITLIILKSLFKGFFIFKPNVLSFLLKVIAFDHSIYVITTFRAGGF